MKKSALIVVILGGAVAFSTAIRPSYGSTARDKAKKAAHDRRVGIDHTDVTLTTEILSPSVRHKTFPKVPGGHHEVPGDRRASVRAPEIRAVQPARNWPVGRFNSIQVNVDAFGNNIVDDAANEPTIAIDPTDLNRVVIGWRQFDTITDNFRQAGWAYSTDAGQTWTFPGVIDPGHFRSDPVLGADLSGNFYYSSYDGVTNDLFKSTDGGVTWSTAVHAYGGDKQWIAVDQTTGMGSGHIYQIWNVQFTSVPGTDFARSIDGGLSFEQPTAMPAPSMKWGVLTVGPDGELYAAASNLGQTAHIVAKSTSAQDPALTPVFEFITTVDLGGVTVNATGPNPGGIVGTVWAAVDHSDGPTRGNVYVFGSVDPVGADPMDVHIIRSVDGGHNWTSPVRVNDGPTGVWEWFGTMSVAPNGRIDAVWNDTRNDATPETPNDAELYYSFSLDAGDTWYSSEVVSPQFDSHIGWPQQNKLGDYYHMISDNAAANLAYSATFNGEQDVYFVRITPDCNDNDIADETDIANLTSPDCNGNLIPDECEPNEDCQPNGVQDICDVAGPTSEDCNHNYVPDECEPNEDCQPNGVQDICDIAAGTSQDCNANDIPDECELAGNDCNSNTVPDECDLAAGTSEDCNTNSIPDECDITALTSPDCQPDGIPDECQIDDVVILTEYSTCAPTANNGDAWCEDFESYPVGSVGSIDGLNGWEGWAGNPAAVAPVAMDRNHTPNGSKSLFIATHDTVRTFTGYDQNASRAWVLSAWVYVPQAMQGVADCIVLCDYDGGGAGTIWAIQLQMSPAAGFTTNSSTGDRLPVITDQWVEIRITVDLDQDFAAIYYGGTLLNTELWAGAGGSMNIAAIDLYSPGSSGFYFDDLSLFPARAVSTDCNLNSVPDDCDITVSPGNDCNANLIPDNCEPNEDCNGNSIQDICDVTQPTSLDCNGNYVPDSCEVNQDCNTNTVQDICDIATGASQDCNANLVPDDCELAGNDCNGNTVPDECDLMEATSADCNGNLIPDECDIAGPLSDDCQLDGVPDECQLEGLAMIAESTSCTPTADNGDAWCDDFESYGVGSIHGLNGWEGWAGNPDVAGSVSTDVNHTGGGANALRIQENEITLRVLNDYDESVAFGWEVQTWLYVPSTMDGLAAVLFWADYDGTDGGSIPGAIAVVDPGSGLFFNWFTGSTLPAIMDQWVEVRLLVDFSRDLAAIVYDGELLDIVPWTLVGGSLGIEGVDLRGVDSSGFYGDDVSVYSARSFTTDCNENGIPDDCDISGGGSSLDDNSNGIPDECECPLPDRPARPIGEAGFDKNRYISIAPGSAGVQTALRVTLTSLPSEFSAYEGTHVWVGEPVQVCENSGQDDEQAPDDCGPVWPGGPALSMWSANLQATQYCHDFGSIGVLQVTDCEIVPGATYSVQAIDCACNSALDCSYSEAMAVSTSSWGNFCGPYDLPNDRWGAPDSTVDIVYDVTACVDKFKNASAAPTKPRADVDPNVPDWKINITSDVTRIIDAFGRDPYPFAGPGTCPP